MDCQVGNDGGLEGAGRQVDVGRSESVYRGVEGEVPGLQSVVAHYTDARGGGGREGSRGVGDVEGDRNGGVGEGRTRGYHFDPS